MDKLNNVGNNPFQEIQKLKDNLGKVDAGGDKKDVSFSETLKSYLSEVNQLQNEADKSIQNFVQGVEDPHQAMLAIQEAEKPFQLLMQVRNKIIEAYQDIMRMPM
ncbi:MAG: flagellar hook-basal body complex protein FliE [bacterium]